MVSPPKGKATSFVSQLTMFLVLDELPAVCKVFAMRAAIFAIGHAGYFEMQQRPRVPPSRLGRKILPLFDCFAKVVAQLSPADMRRLDAYLYNTDKTGSESIRSIRAFWEAVRRGTYRVLLAEATTTELGAYEATMHVQFARRQRTIISDLVGRNVEAALSSNTLPMQEFETGVGGGPMQSTVGPSSWQKEKYRLGLLTAAERLFGVSPEFRIPPPP